MALSGPSVAPFASVNLDRVAEGPVRRQSESGSCACFLHPGQRLSERLSAALQRLALFLGQVGLEDLCDALPSDNARQGQRDPVRRVVRADRDHRALVAQDYFRKARAHHADSVLTCANSFDDGDVGVADFLLDTLLKLLAIAVLVR